MKTLPHDRFGHAAINILKRALSTVGHTGIYAGEPVPPQMEQLAWREALLGGWENPAV